MMKPDELYEVVKNVPRSAWPNGAIWNDAEGRWWLQRDINSAGWPTYPEAAMLLFEASMTRWLIGEGYHTFEWGNGESPTVTLDLYEHHFSDSSERDSLVKLLAAACRELKGAPQ